MSRVMKQTRTRQRQSVLLLSISLAIEIGVAFAMVACADSPPRRLTSPVQSPREVSNSPPRIAKPAPPPPVERSVIERYIQPLEWFAAHPQPVERALGISNTILPTSPFPGSPVAYVEVVERGFAEVHTEPFDGCEFISNRGSYCPRVLASPKRLSGEQMARLMAVVEDPPKKFGTKDNPDAAHFESRIQRYEPDPGMAFVFFDAHDRSVGVAAFTRDCGAWEFSPRIVDRWSGFADLNPEERAVVKALHDELGLYACTVGEDPYFSETFEVRSKRLFSLLVDEKPVKDDRRPLSSASPDERQRLCVWASRTVRTAAYLRFGSDDHYFDGDVFGSDRSEIVNQLLLVKSCLTQFPDTCSNTTIANAVDEVRRTAVGISKGEFIQVSPCAFGVVPMPATLFEDFPLRKLDTHR